MAGTAIGPELEDPAALAHGDIVAEAVVIVGGKVYWFEAEGREREAARRVGFHGAFGHVRNAAGFYAH